MLLSELKLFSLLIIFLIIPGMSIITYFFRNISVDMLVLLALIISFFCWTILSMIGFIFSLSLETITIIWVIIIPIAILWLLYQKAKNRLFQIALPRLNNVLFLFVLFVFLTSLLMYWKGSFQDGDAWYHVAQASNYRTQMQMVSESAYFSGYPAGTLYDFNAWHTFIAGISLIGRFQPNFVWINLSSLFLPITILALFTFIKTVFENQNFAVIATIVIVITQTIFEKFLYLSSTIIPANISTAYIIPLFFTIQFSENVQRKYQLQSMILIVSAFIHIYYFLVIIGYLVVFHCTESIFIYEKRIELKQSLLKTAGFFLIGMPYLFAIYWYSLRDYAYIFPGTELPLKLVFGNMPIFKLTADKSPFYLSVIISLLLLVKSSFWRKNSKRLFILINILIVPLLIYNPVFLKVLSQFVPLNLVGRLTAPFFLLIPLVWFIWEYLFKNISINRIRIGFSSVVAVFALIFVIYFMPIRFKERLLTYDKYNEPMGFSAFSTDFKQQIEPKSTVISDSYVSYHLPVFADIDIVSMIAHSTPPIDLISRIRDNNRFLNPLISTEIKESIRKKYRIQYAVINRSTIPWTRFSNQDILFTGHLYPDYNYNQENNIVVFKIKPIFDNVDMFFPSFMPIEDKFAVLPTPNRFDKKEISWDHAGMIFIKINRFIKDLLFHSKGGTHHVFYYSILDDNLTIVEEKVYVNDFSSKQIYRINNLEPGYWVVFSGNGISPLTIQTEG